MNTPTKDQAPEAMTDERAAFEQALTKMPAWAPEYEQHRPWVNALLWFIWHDCCAMWSERLRAQPAGQWGDTQHFKREIGEESDWTPCTHAEYVRLSKDPHHDTKAVTEKPTKPAGQIDPDAERKKARADLNLYGVGFLVDGRHVPAMRVSAIWGDNKPAGQAGGEHPLSRRCYVMSETHLSGARLTIGFNTIEEADDAHTWVANLRKPTAPQQQAGGEVAIYALNAWRQYYASREHVLGGDEALRRKAESLTFDAIAATPAPELKADSAEHAPMLDNDGRAMIVNSHHYTAINIRAVIDQLKSFSNPEKTTQSDWDNLDWRGYCNVLWRLMAGLASDLQPAPEPMGPWYDGAPPFPQDQEWFIAETTHGDRVVLRAFDGDANYQYTTADHTYMKAGIVERWMQFPDSEYVPPETRPAPARFPSVSCSQCGCDFGPGNEGFSHCQDHAATPAPEPEPKAEPVRVPEGFSLDQIADACVQAEISDSKFESLSIALTAAQAKGGAA